MLKYEVENSGQLDSVSKDFISEVIDSFEDCLPYGLSHKISACSVFLSKERIHLQIVFCQGKRNLPLFLVGNTGMSPNFRQGDGVGKELAERLLRQIQETKDSAIVVLAIAKYV